MKKANKNIIFAFGLAFGVFAGVDFALAEEATKAAAGSGGGINLGLQSAESYGVKDMGTVDNIASWLFDTVRYLLGAVALVFGSIAIAQMVMNQGDEGEAEKAKTWLKYGLAGLVIFSLAEPAKNIFGVGAGELFIDGQNVETTSMGVNQVILTVLNFAQYLLGAVAVIMIISSGLAMISSQGDEGQMGKQKAFFTWGIGGLFLFMLSGQIIATVYGAMGMGGYAEIGMDETQGRSTLLGMMDWVLYIVGALAVLVMIVAAIMYTTSGASDDGKEKAKKMIIGAVIAIVLAYSSYTIVSEIVGATSGASTQVIVNVS